MYLIGATGSLLLACFSFGVKLSHLKWRLQSNPKHTDAITSKYCRHTFKRNSLCMWWDFTHSAFVPVRELLNKWEWQRPKENGVEVLLEFYPHRFGACMPRLHPWLHQWNESLMCKNPVSYAGQKGTASTYSCTAAGWVGWGRGRGHWTKFF